MHPSVRSPLPQTLGEASDNPPWAARAVVRGAREPDPWLGRLWQVVPWGVAWFVMSTYRLSPNDDSWTWQVGAPKGATLVGYVFWAYIVVRLTHHTLTASAKAVETKS